MGFVDGNALDRLLVVWVCSARYRVVTPTERQGADVIKIEVKSSDIATRNVVAKTGSRAGQAFQIRNQIAYAYVIGLNGDVAPYPEKIELRLDDQQPPYPPGMYTIDPGCLYVGKFSALTLGPVRLRPVATRQAAAA